MCCCGFEADSQRLSARQSVAVLKWVKSQSSVEAICWCTQMRCISKLATLAAAALFIKEEALKHFCECLHGNQHSCCWCCWLCTVQSERSEGDARDEDDDDEDFSLLTQINGRLITISDWSIAHKTLMTDWDVWQDWLPLSHAQQPERIGGCWLMTGPWRGTSHVGWKANNKQNTSQFASVAASAVCFWELPRAPSSMRLLITLFATVRCSLVQPQCSHFKLVIWFNWRSHTAQVVQLVSSRNSSSSFQMLITSTSFWVHLEGVKLQTSYFLNVLNFFTSFLLPAFTLNLLFDSSSFSKANMTFILFGKFDLLKNFKKNKFACRYHLLQWNIDTHNSCVLVTKEHHCTL